MPGERLIESKIGEYYNASRTPVREALKQLGNEKLAKYSPRKGYIVSKMSMREILDLYEVRRVLEPAAMEHLAKSIELNHRNSLKKILTDIEISIDKEDFSKAKFLIIHWNQTAIHAVENPYIKKYLLSNNEKLYRLSNYLLKYRENVEHMVPYIFHMFSFIEKNQVDSIFIESKNYIDEIITLLKEYNDPQIFSLK